MSVRNLAKTLSAELETLTEIEFKLMEVAITASSGRGLPSTEKSLDISALSARLSALEGQRRADLKRISAELGAERVLTLLELRDVVDSPAMEVVGETFSRMRDSLIRIFGLRSRIRRESVRRTRNPEVGCVQASDAEQYSIKELASSSIIVLSEGN